MVAESGTVNRILSTAPRKADGIDNFSRFDRTGERYYHKPLDQRGSAYEGSGVALTAAGTIDTGINMSVATGTTFAATQAMFYLYNGDANRDIILDWFKLYQITADTGGVLQRVIHKIDKGNRYSSGGTAMSQAQVNGNGAFPSNLVAVAGAVVLTAEVNAQLIGSNIIANGVGAKGVEINIKYGTQEAASNATIPTTSVVSFTTNAPAIVIPPGYCYVMNEFKTGRSATGTGEFYAGIIVR
jgi:hypothetical protein